MSNQSLIIAIFCLPLITGCSVFMAANKTGISAEKLGECRTRTCVISKGAISASVKKNVSGTITEETYTVKKPSGSAARAAMHGLLDISTLGIWEIAGTPIEGTLNKKEHYSVKIIYQNDGETIKTVQLN